MNLGWQILHLHVYTWTSWDTPTIPVSSRDGHSSPPLSEYRQYDPRMNLGWQILHLHVIHGLPGILRPSQDHPGMDTAHLPSLSEYFGIPGILRPSQDHPGMDTAHPPPCLSIWDSWDTPTIPGSSWDGHSTPSPCLSILGFPGYSDHSRIIPRWTQLTLPLSEYLGIPVIL